MWKRNGRSGLIVLKNSVIGQKSIMDIIDSRPPPSEQSQRADTNELLRLVYRLIFLMVAEDRNLLHPTNAKTDARALYAQGYSLAALRKQCYRAATLPRSSVKNSAARMFPRAAFTAIDFMMAVAKGTLDSRPPSRRGISRYAPVWMISMNRF